MDQVFKSFFFVFSVYCVLHVCCLIIIRPLFDAKFMSQFMSWKVFLLLVSLFCPTAMQCIVTKYTIQIFLCNLGINIQQQKIILKKSFIWFPFQFEIECERERTFCMLDGNYININNSYIAHSSDIEQRYIRADIFKFEDNGRNDV